MTTGERDVRSVADCRVLTDLTTDFAWYIDTKRFDDAAGLLVEDCAFHVGERETRGRAALGELLTSTLSPYAVTVHHLTNQVFTVGGDRATGRIQVWAWHRPLPADGPDTDVNVLARYTDAYARTAEGWRIAQRGIEVLGTWRTARG